MMPVKADLAICSSAIALVCLDSVGVWLSCQAIIWISVLVKLFRVYANQVTFCRYTSGTSPSVIWASSIRQFGLSEKFQYMGVSPTMIGFVTLGHFLLIRGYA